MRRLESCRAPPWGIKTKHACTRRILVYILCDAYLPTELFFHRILETTLMEPKTSAGE
jgi:hypothetical protein